MAKPSLNPVLKKFWRKPARNRVLYGGRASSKSWDAAGFAIFLASNYKIRVLCTRHFQNKIEESVYALLKVQIERFCLKDIFKVTNNSIVCTETGSEFLFYGIARNIDEIKSTESVDILWMEEAHLLTKSQWEVIEPTIRKEGSQVWVIFNPRFASDFVYQRFVVNPPPNTIVRKINYTENPFLSRTMLDIINAAEEEDYEDFKHIYLGEPDDNDDNSIIKRSWLTNAVDAHITLGIDIEGVKRIGFDIADSGADLCATIYAHGIVALTGEEWKGKEDELLKSCSRAYSSAVQYDSQIIYDSIGVGAHAGSKFNELNEINKKRIKHSRFNAGGLVHKPELKYRYTNITNKEMFLNLKAQAWWMVADRFRITSEVVQAIRTGNPVPKHKTSDLISISSGMPNIEKLLDELSTPHRDFDTSGKVKVESKKDLAKRDIPSPNRADAFIMAFTPTIQQSVVITTDLLSQI